MTVKTSKKKIILLFILLAMQLFAQPITEQLAQLQLTENEKIWLAEHTVIKVGMDPDYAPYEWTDKDGNHIGMVVDYMHRLERILGLHFEVVQDKSWSQLLEMAKNRELDMLTSIVKTPERSQYLTFSEPYRDTPTIIIDNGKGTFIGSLKQLSGKRVSVEKGYFMEEFIKNNYPKIILISSPSTKKALQMVFDGSVDAYVGDANVADYTIKTNNFDTLRFSGQTEYISHQSFGLTKENEVLAHILSKAMATIPKEESDAMFNHWLNIEPGIKSETIIKYGSAIAFIFIIIASWVYVLKREVSYRKRAEEKLQISEALYRQLTEDMIDVIWKADKNLYFTYISPSVKRALGFLPEELIGHHIFELFTQEGISTSKERMRQREEDQKAGKYEEYSLLELQHKRKDGSLIWGEIISKPELDENKNIIGYHGISRDITQRKELQEKIQELAFYDPLTKLANRRLLHDRLGQTISSSKRSQKYAAIIYLDLDNFKPLNDLYGHLAGDFLLVEVANRLKKCVREVDTVARVGGDEFALIINELNEDKETSTEEAFILAQKILSSLSAPYILNMNNDATSTIEHYSTASIGVIVFKADTENQMSLFAHADAAMYEAKEAGRNRVHFYAE